MVARGEAKDSAAGEVVVGSPRSLLRVSFPELVLGS
jgi:hypothetical protein